MFFFVSSWLQLFLLFALVIYVTHLFNRITKNINTTTSKVENFAAEINRTTEIVTRNVRNMNDVFAVNFNRTTEIVAQSVRNMNDAFDRMMSSVVEQFQHAHPNQGHRVFEYFDLEERHEHD